MAEVATPCSVLWVGGEGAGSGFNDQITSASRRPKNGGTIAEDGCLIIYTSGSTGEPKGVVLTHANVCNSAVAITGYLGNTPGDVVLCVLPLCYSYGLFQVLGGGFAGYTCLIEKSFAYPQDVLRRAAGYRFTGFAGVPTMFNTLLQMAPFDGLDLSSLRYMTNAAAPVAPAAPPGRGTPA